MTRNNLILCRVRLPRRAVLALTSSVLFSTSSMAVKLEEPPTVPAAPPPASGQGRKTPVLIAPTSLAIASATLQKVSIDKLESLLTQQAGSLELSINATKRYRKWAGKTDKTPIDDLPLALRPFDADQVRAWAGELLKNGEFTLDRYYDFTAVLATHRAAQYGSNVIAITNAIAVDRAICDPPGVLPASSPDLTPYGLNPKGIRKLPRDQRMALLDMYSGALENALEVTNLFLDLAKDAEKVAIDKLPADHQPADADQFLAWSGTPLDKGQEFTLDLYYLLKARYWKKVADQYDSNGVAIGEVLMGELVRP